MIINALIRHGAGRDRRIWISREGWRPDLREACRSTDSAVACFTVRSLQTDKRLFTAESSIIV